MKLKFAKPAGSPALTKALNVLAGVPPVKLPPASGNGPPQGKCWDLYKDGVTQGFINRFMSCREQTRLHYVEGYSVKGSSLWFEFGHCIHFVLSEAYKEYSPPLPGNILCMIKAYQERKEQEANNGKAFQKADFDLQEIVYGVAEAILPVYINKYRDDWNNNWCYNETAFNVPWKLRNGMIVPVRGRIDGGFLREVPEELKAEYPYGKLVLLDTKNLSFIDEDIIAATLPFDTQCMLYLWAVKRMVQIDNDKRKQRGIKALNPLPSEFIYNVIRRPQQRRKKDESVKDFVQRINTEIFGEPEHYFIRFPMKVDLTEIDYWEKHQLTPIMEQIYQWWQAGCQGDLHWTNPQALVSKYGKSDMFDLITRGDKSRYFKKTVAFPELLDELPLPFKPALVADYVPPITKPTPARVVEDI